MSVAANRRLATPDPLSIPTSPASTSPSRHSRDVLAEQPEIDTEANTKKSSLVLSGFPFSLVLDITSSEPRDVLQSERTTLVFVRFATSLFFTALGIMYNFKLKTSDSDSDSDSEASTPSKYSESRRSVFSTVVSFILIALALATLIISWINYFVTIRHYADHKIYTYSFNNFSTVVVVTAVIITLIGICIALVVESVLQES